MDLAIETPPVSALDLAAPACAETSATIAARVANARTIQQARAQQLGDPRDDPQAQRESPPTTNAKLPDALLQKLATPDKQGAALLVKAAETLNLSARAYTRTLRVARTIADLEASEEVKRRHISEAISYRRRDDNDQNANIARPTAPSRSKHN